MISISTNASADSSAYKLRRSNGDLQRSLTRLSTGLKTGSSAEDAGGFAVSMKLAAAIRRTDAAIAHVGNALSFLQVQDGVLATADKVMARMSEMATRSLDAERTDSDRAIEDKGFGELANELAALASEEFNGIGLFVPGGNTLVVLAGEDGGRTAGITQADLAGIAGALAPESIATPEGAVAAGGRLAGQIPALAELRATNHAEQEGLVYAADLLAVNKLNLEAANRSVIDADVAIESIESAKWTIRSESETAIIAQANLNRDKALDLLD